MLQLLVFSINVNDQVLALKETDITMEVKM